jgi:hypothetical protein
MTSLISRVEATVDRLKTNKKDKNNINILIKIDVYEKPSCLIFSNELFPLTN